MKPLLAAGALFVVSSGFVFADPIILFDNLTDSTPVPAGYHLLKWPGFTAVDGVNFPINPSGYQVGVVSSNIAVYPADSTSATISADLFDLHSAYLTAAWNDNLQLEAKGYIHGTLVYDTTNTLSAITQTLIHFDYYGVDKVDFISSGGTHHAGYAGSGTHFVMDNVSVEVYGPFFPGVTNGGFETGDFSGWSHFGATNFDSVASASYAHSGTYGAALGPDGGFANLEQDMVGTTAGQSYQLSFWLENFGGPNTNQLFVFLGGEIPFSQTNLPIINTYTNMQFTISATLPRVRVEFSYENDHSYFGLDDVSVTALPTVTNGGFETGDFSGWTQSGNTLDTSVSAAVNYTRSGNYGAKLGPGTMTGFLSQTLATYPGQPYLVSFWLDSYDITGNNEFAASWDANTLFDQTNVPGFGWTNLHFTVMATNQQPQLKFGFHNNPAFFGLDEVSVLPIPIVTNGGFEDGGFGGWTQSGNTAFTSVVATNPAYVSSGACGAKLGPIGSPGFLSQTVNTLPGQSYLLSCWFDTPDGATPNEFGVSWNGTTLLDATNWAAIGWINVKYLVQATSTNGTIQFNFQNNSSFFGLDEMTLQPVLAPQFLSVTNTGGKTFLTWSTMPGFSYLLQFSPDLTNWNNIGFGLGATSSTMSATNASVASKRFYRVFIQQPGFLD